MRVPLPPTPPHHHHRHPRRRPRRQGWPPSLAWVTTWADRAAVLPAVAATGTAGTAAKGVAAVATAPWRARQPKGPPPTPPEPDKPPLHLTRGVRWRAHGGSAPRKRATRRLRRRDPEWLSRQRTARAGVRREGIWEAAKRAPPPYPPQRSRGGIPARGGGRAGPRQGPPRRYVVALSLPASSPSTSHLWPDPRVGVVDRLAAGSCACSLANGQLAGGVLPINPPLSHTPRRQRKTAYVDPSRGRRNARWPRLGHQHSNRRHGVGGGRPAKKVQCGTSTGFAQSTGRWLHAMMHGPRFDRESHPLHRQCEGVRHTRPF